ncbi:hypothetical protein LZ30DRAFT_158121 [Colletotrichum cereale]|nr:hypothetical protein LZ30DRAFT_158121 [Colletotrichum cereale]
MKPEEKSVSLLDNSRFRRPSGNCGVLSNIIYTFCLSFSSPRSRCYRACCVCLPPTCGRIRICREVLRLIPYSSGLRSHKQNCKGVASKYFGSSGGRKAILGAILEPEDDPTLASSRPELFPLVDHPPVISDALMIRVTFRFSMTFFFKDPAFCSVPSC